MSNIGRRIGIAHDRKLFVPIDKFLNRTGDNVMVLHVADRQIRTHHLRHLPSETAGCIDNNLARHFALLGVNLPLPRRETIDIHHAIVSHDFHP